MQISQVSSFTCPRLFQPQIHNLKVNTQASDDNYIPLPKVHNSKELLRHKQFPKIQQQFLTDISELKRLAHTYVNHTYDTKINRFYERITASHGLTNSDLLLIYEKIRYEIHNIVAEISKPQNTESHDYIANFLHGCLEGIDLCLAGVASRFNFSISNLKIIESGLQGFIYKIRYELAQEFISKFTFEQEKQGALDVYIGNKIHYFNAFYNMLSEQLELESVSDIHAPKHLPDKVIKAFYEAAPLHVNGFSIIQKVKNYWVKSLSQVLKKQNISYWETHIIPAKEMVFEHLEKINKKVFEVINSLHGTKDKAAINFLTITEEVESGGYSMCNFQEKIHAWLANYFCDEAPKVFCKVCTNEHGTQYIGSMSNLFFWVFNCDMPLNIKAHCDFNLSKHISVTLNHLITLDFNTWPVEHFHPLLMQALSQSKTANDFLTFFSNDFVLGQLHNLSDTTRTMFFNCIVEKYIVSKNKTLKQLLCKCMVYYVLFQDKKLIFNTKLAYFEDTPLYQGIEQEIQNDCDALRKILNTLTLSQLLSLAYKHIDMVFQETDYDLKTLVIEAIRLEKMPFLLQLVKSTYADSLLGEQDDYKDKLLLLFAKYNDLAAIEYLLPLPNINVNFKDEDGNTPLLHAAKENNTNCVRILLAHNNIIPTVSKIKQKTDTSLRLFNFIAYFNPLPFLQSLLWNNAYVTLLNKMGRNLFHPAANKGQTGCLETLVNIKDIQVNMQNKDGWTALHYAANYGNKDCLKALLNIKDIQVNIRNYKGWTALHYAARYGHVACLKNLLSNNNIEVNKKCNHDFTPLHYASKYGHIACLKNLLSNGDIQVNKQTPYGWTSLHFAAINGHGDCFKALLNFKDIQVNMQNYTGWTALHCVVNNGDADCLKALLDIKDIQVNMQDNKSLTALHRAARYGHIACLNILLSSHNIQVNKQNRIGRTALHLAAINGHVDCLKTLLNIKDIQVNMQDSRLCTALDYAATYGHIACLKNLLSSHNIQVNKQKNDGCTVLHLAARNGHASCLKALLNTKHVQVNMQNNRGWTALHFAACYGHNKCLNILLSSNTIDINKQDKHGRTPLHFAACFGHTECVKILLSSNAININKQDNQGRTPLEYCHIKCINLLLKHG